MDSKNALAPTGTVVVRPEQRKLTLKRPASQAATYTPDGALSPRAHEAAWGFTPITLPGAWRITKRAIDLVGSVLGIVVTSPVWILAAIAVRCEGQGSMLFRQVRVGRNGRQFVMLKFRTMCMDAETRKADLAPHNEMTGPVFKMQNDPRVTRLGRLLRKYSVDELPQLLNVLRGEMSLVGPRPALPAEVSQYEPWQRQRLCVRPGLTCLWQVNGRNEVDFEEWMRLDLEYIHRCSLALDVAILAKTVPAVLKGTGV